VVDPVFQTRAELGAALEAALDPEVKDWEIDGALHAERIFQWGPDAERFVRMFEAVMKVRRVTLSHHQKDD
jgi:hypothetical protein